MENTKPKGKVIPSRYMQSLKPKTDIPVEGNDTSKTIQKKPRSRILSNSNTVLSDNTKLNVKNGFGKENNVKAKILQDHEKTNRMSTSNLSRRESSKLQPTKTISTAKSSTKLAPKVTGDKVVLSDDDQQLILKAQLIQASVTKQLLLNRFNNEKQSNHSELANRYNQFVDLTKIVNSYQSYEQKSEFNLKMRDFWEYHDKPLRDVISILPSLQSAFDSLINHLQVTSNQLVLKNAKIDPVKLIKSMQNATLIIEELKNSLPNSSMIEHQICDLKGIILQMEGDMGDSVKEVSRIREMLNDCYRQLSQILSKRDPTLSNNIPKHNNV
ncbi:hypothetical protein HDV02_003329 [Globomyces sp. JEL0801]|nr:hypothetical protein HDV02_003329 [Globomyces sp. JEL0801]